MNQIYIIIYLYLTIKTFHYHLLLSLLEFVLVTWLIHFTKHKEIPFTFLQYSYFLTHVLVFFFFCQLNANQDHQGEEASAEDLVPSDLSEGKRVGIFS